MLDLEVQIEKLEKQIDEYLDSDIEPEFLNKLLDELEELLVTQEEYYTIRILQ